MSDRNVISELRQAVPTLADTDRIRDIAAHFRKIIELLGLDLTDPNLVETPERVAKMYLELFEGLTEGPSRRSPSSPTTSDTRRWSWRRTSRSTRSARITSCPSTATPTSPTSRTSRSWA